MRMPPRQPSRRARAALSWVAKRQQLDLIISIFPTSIPLTLYYTMSGWMSWFGGRKDTREQARDSIVDLRQQLLMIEKKEEHLQKKIDDETSKARANATSNKSGASSLT